MIIMDFLSHSYNTIVRYRLVVADRICMLSTFSHFLINVTGALRDNLQQCRQMAVAPSNSSFRSGKGRIGNDRFPASTFSFKQMTEDVSSLYFARE